MLFVCNHNAGRSQMAQAFFERFAPDDMRAESAGSNPAEQVWPAVVEAMREVGIDLAGRKPKKLLPEMQLHADWAVTMGCDDACPYVPDDGRGVGHPRPSRAPARRGPRHPRHASRPTFASWSRPSWTTSVRDPTAHRLRLQRLLPQLAEEFEGRRSPAEIRACADAILDAL